jgi:hypothetical protein
MLLRSGLLSKVPVDPHTHREQPVTRQESITGESLHSLAPINEDGAAAIADGQSLAPSTTKAATSPLWSKEQRQSCRFRCSGRAEFRAEGSDTGVEGALTIISLHGCYLEMSTTFPVGTRADLMLTAAGIRIHAAGEVRSTFPWLGMGILFSELEPAHRLQLKDLLVGLAWNGPVPLSLPAAAAKDTKGKWRAAEARALIDEITAFFQENQLLSREEFHQFVTRIRRS